MGLRSHPGRKRISGRKKEVTLILCCPQWHRRKRLEKLLALAAPSLHLTHHPRGTPDSGYLCRSAVLSFKAGRGSHQGTFTWADGARAGEERTILPR